MKLPEYTVPQLCLDRLRNDIIDTALERNNFAWISTDVARTAIFQYMSFSGSVFNNELNAFELELHKNSVFKDYPALDVIALLSAEVNAILNVEESYKINSMISLVDVDAALKAAGYYRFHKKEDLEYIRTIIADVLVMGADAAEEENFGLLEIVGLSIQEIEKIIKEK